MSLSIEKITDKIVRISATTQDELSATFLRFQEYYESPEFKGRIFTLGEFRRWYSEKYGAFTYYQDWTGFNIPSSVLVPFKNGLFDPLTSYEYELVRLFKDRPGPFYIIGANSGTDVLEHEICHGLYSTSKPYADAVLKYLLKNIKELSAVRDFVLDKGYHESVVLDEVHAYVSADYDYLLEKGVQVDGEHHKALRKIRNQYFKGERKL